MGGGSKGGGNTTTTTKADPWVGVQPYLTSGYQQLGNLYQPGQGPQYYSGSTVADPSGWTQLGQESMLGQMGNLNSMAQGGAQSVQNMANYGANATQVGQNNAVANMNSMYNLGANAQGGLSGALSAMNRLNAAGDPSTNQYFQGALQSAIRPVTQQFQEQVLPSLRQGAQESGQFGGSRQGIAEGLAARGYTDTIGDISSNMGNAAYAQGLQAMQSAGQLGSGLAGLSGQMYSGAGNLGANLYGMGTDAMGRSAGLNTAAMQGLTMPGQLQQMIGQQQTDQRQQGLDADVQRWNYNQNLPYTMISDYLAMLNGAQGGSTTAQQSGGSGSNRTMGALGGAASGAAMGSMFGPVGMGIGAAAGGLYGMFG